MTNNALAKKYKILKKDKIIFTTFFICVISFAPQVALSADLDLGILDIHNTIIGTVIKTVTLPNDTVIGNDIGPLLDEPIKNNSAYIPGPAQGHGEIDSIIFPLTKDNNIGLQLNSDNPGGKSCLFKDVKDIYPGAGILTKDHRCVASPVNPSGAYGGADNKHYSAQLNAGTKFDIVVLGRPSFSHGKLNDTVNIPSGIQREDGSGGYFSATIIPLSVTYSFADSASK